MSVLDLPERLLQRAVHGVLASPSRVWQCTNGDVLQIVATGLHNVDAGPDFQDMAVLHCGTLYVGDGEFHKRTSDWFAHAHTGSERYRNLLLHIVVDNDTHDETLARWTLVVPADVLAQALNVWRKPVKQVPVELEELQHFALLRLLRLTANAQALLSRLGVHEATKAMTNNWLSRLQSTSRRPLDPNTINGVRQFIVNSTLGRLIQDFENVPAAAIIETLHRCEKVKIANEGIALRREVITNVVIPLLCAIATHDQRVVLLHWFWSAKATHEYGAMKRRFKGQPQDFVWEQQGMLEYIRHHGRRISTCGEAIRAYGVAGTLEFLRASG